MNSETLNIEVSSSRNASPRIWSRLFSAPILNGHQWGLIFSALVLTLLGILEIYASSSIPAFQRYGDPFIFLRKQVVAASIGFTLILFARQIRISWLQKLTLPAVIMCLIFLGLIFVPMFQYRAGHAARWVRILGFTFQPAELAKIALVLFLARNLSRPTCNVRHLSKGLLPNFLIFAVFACLIMPQPDFGTTVLLFSVTFLMVYVAGASRGFIIGLFGVGILGIVAAIATAPYRLKRFLTFLQPFANVREGGYQIIQSYLGFQNGGLWGLGLGESKQKLFFLPEAHTDFILAVIGEELGLFAVLLIAGCFLFMTLIGLSIARHQTGQYQRFLALGLTSLIGIQGAFNMSVAMGLLPTKGIPLPFVSNGPTCLLVFLTNIAILVRLGSYSSDQKASSKFDDLP